MMKIALIKKNEKRQVAHSVAMTPDMKDKGGDTFGADVIMDASHLWVEKGSKINLFHDQDIDPSDARIVENHLTWCDFQVDLEKGSIEPIAMVSTDEIDEVIKTADGNEITEVALLCSMLEKKLKNYKLIKANKNKKVIKKGSWVTATKFYNKELWKDVVDGKLRAMSIEGYSTDHEDIDD